MKKVKFLIISSLACIFLFSCNSTNVPSDSDYDSESSIVVKRTVESDLQSPKMSFWDKVLGKDKFTVLDEFNIGTASVIFTVNTQDGIIVINNKSKTVGFGSPYQLAYYYVTFNDDNRTKLLSLIEKYFNDFDEKKLDRNDSKSYKAYGQIKCRLDWGDIKGSTPNYANATCYVGYKFNGKSPYFTLTMYSTVNQKMLNGEEGVVDESMNLNYFLTKKQCTSLTEHLNDTFLINFIDQEKEKENAKIESDEY